MGENGLTASSTLKLREDLVGSRAIHCPLSTCDESHYYEPDLKFKVDKALHIYIWL